MKVYVNGGERTSVANTQEYNNGTMGGNNQPFFAIGYDNGTIYDPFHGHIDNVHVQSAATYNGMPELTVNQISILVRKLRYSIC